MQGQHLHVEPHVVPKLEEREGECSLWGSTGTGPDACAEQLCDEVASMRAVAVTNSASMNAVHVTNSKVLGLRMPVCVRTFAALVPKRDGECDAGEVAPLEVSPVPSLDPMEPSVDVSATYTRGAAQRAALTFNTTVLCDSFTTTADLQPVGGSLPGEHMLADRVQMGPPLS